MYMSVQQAISLHSNSLASLCRPCAQAVAEVRGHPENFAVLSQQSPGEGGRRADTKRWRALFARSPHTRTQLMEQYSSRRPNTR